MEHLIERSLISGLIVSPELLPYCDLCENDFADPGCRIIFKKIKELVEKHLPVDVSTIAAEFNEKKFTAYVKDIMSEYNPSISPDVIQGYCEMIRKDAIMRNVKRQAELLAEIDDFEEMQRQCNKFPDIANYSNSNDEMTSADGAVDFYQRLHEKKEYIKTGFEIIDDKTYITRGDYIIIGGRPSNGKTAFSIQMMNYISQYMNVVFFSLETSREKIYDRVMANLSKLLFSKIKTGQLDKADMPQITAGMEQLAKLRINVVNAAGYSVNKIKAKALKLKADVVIIDYLGLIKSSGKNRYEKVTNISVDLHTMAQQYGITTIALSQLNRNKEKKEEKSSVPTMSDLRESGQIEQDADLIFLMHDRGDDNDFDVIVAKNKEGQTGAVKMKFYKDIQTFCNFEKRLKNA